MISHSLVVALALAATQSALAQHQQAEHDPTEISSPSWRVPPAVGPDDYPEFARLLALPGKVQLGCRGSATGQIISCKVIDERPAGLGFGEAALRIAGRGWLNPRSVDGTSTSSEVHFRIPFMRELDAGDTPPQPWTSPDPSEAAAAAARIIIARLKAQPGNSEVEPLRADVAPDRRDLVQSWVDELMPTQAVLEETGAIALARVVPEDRLMLWASTEGLPPQSLFPAPASIYLAMGGLPNDAAAAAELRRRYCGRYDCTTGR